MKSRFAEYEAYTDEELIDRFHNGERQIMDYICEKYKNLVRSKASSMFIIGGDKDDLIQEGMIGLFKAVENFDCGRDASFMTFADLCISRQMYTAVQAAQRKKHLPLNTYHSLDYLNQEGVNVGEIVTAASEQIGNSPEERVLDKERMEYISKAIEEELSDFERQVLDLHLTGMTYSQIAKVLGREEKATDNALQRMKAKIRKIIAAK